MKKKKIIISFIASVVLIIGIFIGFKILQPPRSTEEKIKNPKPGDTFTIEGEKEIEEFKKEAEKNGQEVRIINGK
ncbi:hypothetical protein [Xylocopilactobacillus apicola]|uniref:Uncharacterized protein n=1 Tax=Xylocopilactobacillus apicola TaxID=2932184 RepID=A0AAU9DE27_9LACO|nr:hypothetical protein [Xylocopilactobacillus apicola]BDR59102.1 hypothetical protein XA3_15430 [Xylocopilactobacillus apicola]